MRVSDRKDHFRYMITSTTIPVKLYVKRGRKKEKTKKSLLSVLWKYLREERKKSKQRKAWAKSFFWEGQKQRYIPPYVEEYACFG